MIGSVRNLMKIGIDFDSTLVNLVPPWLAKLNRHCGTEYRVEQWKDFAASFLPEHHRTLLFDLYTPDVYDTVVPYVDAPEVISDLALFPDVELVCVSANPGNYSTEIGEAKKRILREHFPILAETVIFDKDKSRHGLDVLVDDGVHNFKDAKFIPVLVEQPWNAGFECAHRFTNWEEGRRVLFSLVNSRA